MASIDLRQCLNAISDVVNNRPRPLREFDQIFMKTADMLLQTEHGGRLFDGKRVVFIGDGDAIGLCLVHLHSRKLLQHGPAQIHVLDFDERVVYSVERFARQYRIADRVTAELYNVADPLPEKHWGQFDGFYTNPPFGKSNDGRSVLAFLRRGIEAVGPDSLGCLILADEAEREWAQRVLFAAQREAVRRGFVVSELLPDFHSYHLDDEPDLKSCTMVIRGIEHTPATYSSEPLPENMHRAFYGSTGHLRIRYVRDLTKGGASPSKDHSFETYPEKE